MSPEETLYANFMITVTNVRVVLGAGTEPKRHFLIQDVAGIEHRPRRTVRIHLPTDTFVDVHCASGEQRRAITSALNQALVGCEP